MAIRFTLRLLFLPTPLFSSLLQSGIPLSNKTLIIYQTRLLTCHTYFQTRLLLLCYLLSKSFGGMCVFAAKMMSLGPFCHLLVHQKA